jgi:hypothetical protein
LAPQELRHWHERQERVRQPRAPQAAQIVGTCPATVKVGPQASLLYNGRFPVHGQCDQPSNMTAAIGRSVCQPLVGAGEISSGPEHQCLDSRLGRL